MSREIKWKWLFYFFGLAIMSLGISMIIEGKALGVSPWDVLHIALFGKVGMSVGSWSVITGLVIVVSTSLIVKQWPKLATWLNMLLCGFFIDFYNWLLPNSTGVMLDIAYFLLGVIVLGVGCALYISPKLGAGPRDTLMILLTRKWGMTIGNARLAMEALIAILGWILGGPMGIGTVIIALFSGYIVQFSLLFFESKLANKIECKGNKARQNEVFSPDKLESLAKESKLL